LVSIVEDKIGTEELRYVKMFCANAIAMFCRINKACDALEIQGKDEDEIWDNVLQYCGEFKKGMKK